MYFRMLDIIYLGTYVTLDKMTHPLKRVSKLLLTILKSQFCSSVSVQYFLRIIFQGILFPYWWWMHWFISLAPRHFAFIEKICFDQIFPVKEENIWSLTSCICLIRIGKKQAAIIKLYIFTLYWIFHKPLFFCLPQLFITSLIPDWNFLQLLLMSRIMFGLQTLAWLWLSTLSAALWCSLGHQNWVSHSSKGVIMKWHTLQRVWWIVSCVFLIILAVKQKNCVAPLLIVFRDSICSSKLIVVKPGLFSCIRSQKILLHDIFTECK